MHRSAFTLVEVAVVVLIIGILSAAAAGHFIGINEDATTVAIMHQLDTVQTRVEVETAIRGGQPPPAILPTWFPSNHLPHHPQNTFGIPELQVVYQDEKTHPSSNLLNGSTAGAFWYNKANGTVRARVTWQGSASATQKFYNLVNRSS